MKLSERWLREWVDLSIDTKTLASQLTMAGLEIESIESLAEETVIEVDLTPNRGDCLSIYGLAREVGVLNRLQVKPLKIQATLPSITDTFPIEIEAPHDCPRYAGRVIKNIRTNAVTPVWMQKRLEQSGIRNIHPVVDVLNYVMLEIGQPMHAFDLAKIKGAIIVRHAKPEEALTLLDGQTLNLNADTLVIADKHQLLAIAGIMGGQECGVSENTTDIFLESALFTARFIAGKARQYSLHTDSSFRFERGVIPTLQVLAIERATQLIIEICGGEPGKVLDVKNEKMLPQPQTLILRLERIQKLIGHTFLPQEVETILRLLGCDVQKSDDKTGAWRIKPPAFRYDISAEIDLIEELVRIIGYDNVPASLPHSQIDFIPPQTQLSFPRVKRALVDLGFQEVITYSFVDGSLQKRLFPGSDMLALLNPISADMGVMRVSLWPGLLGVAKYNQHRQQARQKLFEIGMRFRPQNAELIQEEVVSGLMGGQRLLENWTSHKENFDFYDIKYPIEKLWQLLGHKSSLTFRPFEHPACHPGQTAEVSSGSQVYGIVGRLHPQIEKELDLTGPFFLFELNKAFFAEVPKIQFTPPSKFPEIRRDIALMVDNTLPVESLTDFVRTSAGEIMREVILFDVYQGQGVSAGKKSVALGLIFQHPSRTLIDNEVEELLHYIVIGLKKEFHADLRD